MTQGQTAGVRKMAEVMMSTESRGYTLESWNHQQNRWAVVMFDLTLARARAYSVYYPKFRILDAGRQPVA